MIYPSGPSEAMFCNENRLRKNGFRINQSGIGLVELLVSVVIGLLVMAGVVQMSSTSNQNAIAAAGASRIQENIRYAFARIAEDLSQSGNLGCISTSLNEEIENNNDGLAAIKNMLGLRAGANQLYDFSNIVTGVEAADNNTFPDGLVAANTDTFRIRYANNSLRIPIIDSTDTTITVSDAASLVDSDGNLIPRVLLAADCSRGAIFWATGLSGNTITHDASAGPPADGSQYNTTTDREVRFRPTDGTANTGSVAYLYANTTGAYQYFIGDSAAAVAAGETCNINNAQQNCALKVRRNGADIELAEGVHDMQIMYGRNTATDGLLFANAAGVGAANWNLVDRLQVTLTFNSIENAAVGDNPLLTKTVTRLFYLPNQL